MRPYLIIDSNPISMQAIQRAFDALGCYTCIGVGPSFLAAFENNLKNTPEVVFLNFDSMRSDPFKTMEQINKKFGVPPKYMALTVSHKQGFKAFKNGVVNVIDKPGQPEEIERAIREYHATHNRGRILCLQYYYDFRYLYLDDIVLLRADNYTTDFFLRDGSVINSFETLKRNHLRLPHNFQRVHNSYVINSYYVKRINQGSKEINLRYYGKAVPVSKKYFINIHTVKSILTGPENPLLT